MRKAETVGNRTKTEHMHAQNQVYSHYEYTGADAITMTRHIHQLPACQPAEDIVKMSHRAAKQHGKGLSNTAELAYKSAIEPQPAMYWWRRDVTKADSIRQKGSDN